MKKGGHLAVPPPGFFPPGRLLEARTDRDRDAAALEIKAVNVGVGADTQFDPAIGILPEALLVTERRLVTATGFALVEIDGRVGCLLYTSPSPRDS